MNEARSRRIAKSAIAALILSAVACDEPAKSAADANQDGGIREGVDKSSVGDKAHCAGDEKH